MQILIQLNPKKKNRQAIHQSIEDIPTNKENLLTFTLDWSLLDSICISSFLSFGKSLFL
jgi:hypothetical protein